MPQLGPQYFSSAVLYDILGTLVAGYGLGVFIAGQASHNSADANAAGGNRVGDAGTTITARKRGGLGALIDALTEVAKNPTFYAFFVGLYLKTLTIPEWIVSGSISCANSISNIWVKIQDG